MNLRWLRFQYIPAELKLSAAQCREVRRRSFQRVRSTRRGAFLLIAALFSLVLASLALTWVDFGKVHESWIWVFRIVYVILFWWLVPALVCMLASRSAVYAILGEMGCEVCLRCGYVLRGLGPVVIQCPECGAIRHRRPSGTSTPVPWDESSRQSLKEVGYDACTKCGAVFKPSESNCPECGAERLSDASLNESP